MSIRAPHIRIAEAAFALLMGGAVLATTSIVALPGAFFGL